MSDRSQRSVADSFALLVGKHVEDEQIPLAQAALVIARIAYPNLRFEAYLQRLDQLAGRVRSRLAQDEDAAAIIGAVNHVLFAEEGFRGNRADYYDPRNSFFNDVLDRKLGIPITLSLLYIEVARHLGFALFGVGMPGHFLLKHYDIEGRELLIDTFNDGRIVTAGECQARLDEIYDGQVTLRPEFLMPVSRRQMLTRMLNNLKNIYLSARNFRKMLEVVELVLAIYPRSPEDVKQRALLRYNLGQTRGALEDWEEYLKMAPEASDAEEIRQTALAIRRKLASLN